MKYRVFIGGGDTDLVDAISTDDPIVAVEAWCAGQYECPACCLITAETWEDAKALRLAVLNWPAPWSLVGSQTAYVPAWLLEQCLFIYIDAFPDYRADYDELGDVEPFTYGR